MLDTQRIRTFLLSLTVVEHALAGWIDTASLREQNILQRRRNPLRPRASNSPILFRQSLSSDATYTICPPRTGHYIVLAGVNYMDGSNTLICNYDDGAQCLYNPAVPGDNSGGSSNVPEQGPPCPSSSSQPSQAVGQCYSTCQSTNTPVTGGVAYTDLDLVVCTIDLQGKACIFDIGTGQYRPQGVTYMGQQLPSDSSCPTSGVSVALGNCPAAQPQQDIRTTIKLTPSAMYFTCPMVDGLDLSSTVVQFGSNAPGEAVLSCQYSQSGSTDPIFCNYDASNGQPQVGNDSLCSGTTQVTEPAPTTGCFTQCNRGDGYGLDQAAVREGKLGCGYYLQNINTGETTSDICIFDAQNGQPMASATFDGQTYSSSASCRTAKITAAQGTCAGSG